MHTQAIPGASLAAFVRPDGCSVGIVRRKDATDAAAPLEALCGIFGGAIESDMLGDCGRAAREAPDLAVLVVEGRIVSLAFYGSEPTQPAVNDEHPERLMLVLEEPDRSAHRLLT